MVVEFSVGDFPSAALGLIAVAVGGGAGVE